MHTFTHSHFPSPLKNPVWNPEYWMCTSIYGPSGEMNLNSIELAQLPVAEHCWWRCVLIYFGVNIQSNFIPGLKRSPHLWGREHCGPVITLQDMKYRVHINNINKQHNSVMNNSHIPGDPECIVVSWLIPPRIKASVGKWCYTTVTWPSQQLHKWFPCACDIKHSIYSDMRLKLEGVLQLSRNCSYVLWAS